MKKKNRNILCGAVAAATAMVTWGTATANATTRIWSPTPTDNTLANLTPDNNYNVAGTPANGDVLLFNSGSTFTTLTAADAAAPASTMNPSGPGTLLYGGATNTGPEIQFAFNAGAGAYTIGSTTDLDNTGNGYTNVILNTGDTSSEIFNPAVYPYARTSGPAAFYFVDNAVGTTLTLNGGVVNNSTTAAAGVVTWQATFSGTNLVVANIIENGVINDGTAGETSVQVKNSILLTLNGANNYSGPTSIQPGNGAGLILGNKSALGTGTLALGANSLTNPTIAANTDLSGSNAVANPISIYPLNPIGITGSNNLTFSGPMDLDGTVAATAYNAGVIPATGTASFNVSNTGITTLSGVITNSSGTINFNKSGAGLLVLSNANTYNGVTAVLQGDLAIQNVTGSATGANAVAVTGGGLTPSILSGTGISTGPLTVTAGGRLAPGINTSGANNDFGVVGDLDLGTVGGMTLTGANLDFDLASSAAIGNSDEILTGGALTLGTDAFTFNELGGSLQTGVPYTLISGFTNTLSSASIAALSGTEIQGGYTPTFSQVGNALDVTFATSSVPEPTGFTLLLGGSAVLLRRRRQSALA